MSLNQSLLFNDLLYHHLWFTVPRHMHEIRKDSEWFLISPAAEDDISCIPNICSAEMSVICITTASHLPDVLKHPVSVMMEAAVQVSVSRWCSSSGWCLAPPSAHTHISYISTVLMFQNRTHFHNEWMGFKIDKILNAKKSNLLSVIHLFVKAKVS